MKENSVTNKINFVDYFPLGLAKAQSFCNRLKEQELLRQNIASLNHTVLISPRRYGKSSLALRAIEHAKLPYEIVDLFVAKNPQSIEQYIVAGVQRLITKVMTTPQQIMKLLRKTLKHLNAKLVLGTNGCNLEFSLSNPDVASNILEVLQTLDEILKHKKITAILFIDEFQQIGMLAQGRGIEGALRHVAQTTHNLMFIFSGSNRHLLTHMFNDSSRPFYKLCQTMHLQRIAIPDYVAYLNQVSRKTWGNVLVAEVFTAIFKCAENHPYYMNALCRRLWLTEQRLTPELIYAIWKEYVFEERSKTVAELDKLTANQYFVLNKIAHGVTTQLTSHVFLSEIKIPSASVIQALSYLEKNDYIAKEKNEYYVVDPLIKSSLLIFSLDQYRSSDAVD